MAKTSYATERDCRLRRPALRARSCRRWSTCFSDSACKEAFGVSGGAMAALWDALSSSALGVLPLPSRDRGRVRGDRGRLRQRAADGAVHDHRPRTHQRVDRHRGGSRRRRARDRGVGVYLRVIARPVCDPGDLARARCRRRCTTPAGRFTSPPSSTIPRSSPRSSAGSRPASAAAADSWLTWRSTPRCSGRPRPNRTATAVCADPRVARNAAARADRRLRRCAARRPVCDLGRLRRARCRRRGRDTRAPHARAGDVLAARQGHLPRGRPAVRRRDRSGRARVGDALPRGVHAAAHAGARLAAGGADLVLGSPLRRARRVRSRRRRSRRAGRRVPRRAHARRRRRRRRHAAGRARRTSGRRAIGADAGAAASTDRSRCSRAATAWCAPKR